MGERENARKRSSRLKKKDAGICTSCSNERVPGKSRCSECLCRNTASCRKTYQQRKEKKLCVECGIATGGHYIHCTSCREVSASRNHKARQRLRSDAILAYGGKCACCGEATHQFLALDHIHNDGGAERKILGRDTNALLRRLRKAGYPRDRYQLLCHNCNAAKAIYGKCPHQL